LEVTAITNDCVASLLKFPNLENLSLAGTKIDDAGIAQLKDAPALKSLDIRFLIISEEVLNELRAAKPDLKLITQ
ncbi:MAG TPA: hypothetical protein VMM56_00525, partial [Planctomycetaceae bacterium]|nr:hypothetical protein [Planctomycetaceae bacterium]